MNEIKSTICRRQLLQNFTEKHKKRRVLKMKRKTTKRIKTPEKRRC